MRKKREQQFPGPELGSFGRCRPLLWFSDVYRPMLHVFFFLWGGVKFLALLKRPFSRVVVLLMVYIYSCL